jgi:Cu/Ag efflux pump CusA
VFNDDVDITLPASWFLNGSWRQRAFTGGIEPVMAPVSTGLGEVYQLCRRAECGGDRSQIVETDLTDQRTLQDWVRARY